jgi:hypothetical protein
LQVLIMIGLCAQLNGCSKSGQLIEEPSIGIIRFTTFTVDTLLFKVFLNDQLITDSLRSPRGAHTASIPFFDSLAKLKIVDANNNTILDSTIKLRIGSKTITLVQFVSGQKPAPAPTPAVAAPAPGNYKIRFQYLQPVSSGRPFYDSIKCQIRREDNGAFIDTVVLKKYDITRYYELPKSVRVKIRLINTPASSFPTTTAFSNAITEVEDFNTVSLYYRAGSGYTLERAY